MLHQGALSRWKIKAASLSGSDDSPGRDIVFTVTRERQHDEPVFLLLTLKINQSK